MDKVVEKTELVISALDYAHKHNLDINNKNDVKKILEALDPDHISEAEVDEFMILLQNADTFLEMKSKPEKNEFAKLNFIS